MNAILRDALPRQGAWSDEEYLWLTDRSRRLIEFTDGYVQELPWPTFSHQAILAFLYRSFHAWVGPRGGVVVFSALRLRVREGMFREPDLLLLRERSDPRCQDRYWLGADLVVEVVSPDRPERDLVDKRIDYAEAGIPEYWAVDCDQTVSRPPWPRYSTPRRQACSWRLSSADLRDVRSEPLGHVQATHADRCRTIAVGGSFAIVLLWPRCRSTSQLRSRGKVVLLDAGTATATSRSVLESRLIDYR